MTEVYKYDTIDFSKIKFTIPEKQSSIYYSNITYDGKPFFLQTSKLRITSNINSLNKKIPSIEFQILGDNFDLYDLFMKLDDKLIKTTYNYSKEWFNQSIPLENIEEMYKCICKPLKKNSNPSIRFKLPMEGGEIISKLYNQNRENIKVENIRENSEAICIVHIRGIKFMKQQYVCDIYINQMKVFISKNNEYIIPDECIIDEDSIENTDEDIIDEEIIINHANMKEKLIKIKLKELEKIKKLEEKIQMMN